MTQQVWGFHTDLRLGGGGGLSLYKRSDMEENKDVGDLLMIYNKLSPSSNVLSVPTFFAQIM